MQNAWNAILAQYGQTVTLRQGSSESALKALLQPVLDRSGLQERPGPLGLEPQERLRYLGPAEFPLDLDSQILWNHRVWQVRSAALAGVGVCPHWWAMLAPREAIREEEPA